MQLLIIHRDRVSCVGDVIYTNSDIQAADAPVPDVQYFWEAFPAGSGRGDRTTYMFTYIDADPTRCSLLLYTNAFGISVKAHEVKSQGVWQDHRSRLWRASVSTSSVDYFIDADLTWRRCWKTTGG